MTLKDLVLGTPFSDVIPYLRMTMDNRDEELIYQLLGKYRNVYDKLSDMKPSNANFSTLLVITKHIYTKDELEYFPWDGEDFKYLEAHPELVEAWWLDVSGRNLDDPADTSYYSLSFSPWAEWLSMEVRPRDVKAHGAGNCLGAILYEITFYGFSEESTQAVKTEVLSREKDAKEHPETLTKWEPSERTEEDEIRFNKIYNRDIEAIKRFEEQNIIEDDLRKE
jgi:hypothetical protein